MANDTNNTTVQENSFMLMVGGAVPSPTYQYAPADFLDAEETRPTELLLDPTGFGISTPYTTVTMNSLSKHLQEVKETQQNPAVLQNSWKRKLREFLLTKHEDLFSFLTKNVPETSPLARVDAFMKKFGRPDFQSSATREKIIDMSQEGQSYMKSLDDDLKALGSSSYLEIIHQTKYIMDKYKQTGEDIIRVEATLRTKLDILDKAQQKLLGIMELKQNTEFFPLLESIKVYLNSIYEDNKVEQSYNELVQLYKKLFFLRESMQFFWMFESAQREPLCAICFQDPVQYALSPCGHTFCNNCCKKQMMQCYICRNSVRERIKLYFS